MKPNTQHIPAYQIHTLSNNLYYLNLPSIVQLRRSSTAQQGLEWPSLQHKHRRELPIQRMRSGELRGNIYSVDLLNLAVAASPISSLPK